MKKAFLILLTLFSLSSPLYASDSVGGFDLNTYHVQMPDSHYQQASEKFQEALLKQVGATDAFNQAQDFMVKYAQRKVDYAIKEFTPFQPHQVYFVAGAAYSLGVKHQFTRSFRDPFLSSVTHTVTVGRDIASTGISFSF